MQRTLLTRTLRTVTPLRPFSSSSLRPSYAPPSSAPPASEPAAPAEPPKLLSYFVPRTAGGQLPVYGDVKSGGSRFETVVRKVDGNVENLRRDLLEYLHDVPSFTKPQSRQVILRGDWTKEVKEWLAARGF